MDELDKLLTDLHQVKRKGSVQEAKTKEKKVSKPVNFGELDDLMSQFAEVLNETSKSHKTAPTPSPVAAPGPTFTPAPAPAPSRASVAPAPKSSIAANQIPFEELNIGRLIGKGNFGAVHEGKYNGNRVAIKELFDTGDTDIEKYYQREIEMLSLSRHPNIVQFHGYCKGKGGKFFMVTEFVDGEDLQKLLKSTSPPWKQRVQISLGIAKAVAFLHGKGIIHRDLKCDNILLTADEVPKVCDFGFARPMESDSKKSMTMCGTDWTMAPEILLCMDYTKAVDVFSYGVILCEVLSRVSPSATNFKRVIPGFGIDPAEIREKAEPGAPKDLVELAIRCTNDEASQRPGFGDIIKELTLVLSDLIEAEEVAEESNFQPQEDTIVETESQKLKASVQQLASTTAYASSASIDFNDKEAITEDLDGVFVRRKLIQTPNFDKFVYAVENTRTHDVLLTIAMEGDNAKVLPAGQAISIGNRKIEGVVPIGSKTIFATVEPLDPNQRLAFSASMEVDRIDVEIRCTEVSSVFLNTHIKHGKFTEISFEVYNKKKDYDVQVELQISGGPLLEGSNTIKGTVRKGEKKIVGAIKTQESVGTSWAWKPIITHPDEVSQVNGVNLIRKHLGGRNFEFITENTRAVPVDVEISFNGSGAAHIRPNPIHALVPAGEKVSVVTLELSGQLGMDWKWFERL